MSIVEQSFSPAYDPKRPVRKIFKEERKEA